MLEFKYFNPSSLPLRSFTNLAHKKQFQNANVRLTQVRVSEKGTFAIEGTYL